MSTSRCRISSIVTIVAPPDVTSSIGASVMSSANLADTRAVRISRRVEREVESDEGEECDGEGVHRYENS